MQKLLFVMGASVFLVACSSKPQMNNAPLDMQSVKAYQEKVYSGNTVAEKYKAKEEKPADDVLNASDNAPKQVIYRESSPPRVMIVPSVGYYRGWY